MKTYSFYEMACFDPATLAVLTAVGTLTAGAGGAAAAANSILGPKPKAPGMPAAAPPVQSPVGSQTSNTGTTQGPSFLAAAASPSAMQLGSKSLLGQ